MKANIENEIRECLGHRRRESQKGDFGKVFLVAGSREMCGAALLAATGALRSGSGLVTLCVPEGIHAAVAGRIFEFLTVPCSETPQGTLSLKSISLILDRLEEMDAFGIGPGLSRVKETQQVIRRVILSTLRPMVIDADGLNALQGEASDLKRLKAPCVLTPHPGEAARVFHREIPKDDEGRKKLVVRLASEYNVLLVLKGHHTVVADPEGHTFVNPTGNPGLATGGSGDLLFGMIVSFLGQGIPPFQAACFGCYLHGLAADLAVKETGEISLLATDVANYLPKAFNKCVKS